MRHHRSTMSTAQSNQREFFTPGRAIVPLRGGVLLLLGWSIVVAAHQLHLPIGDPASSGSLLMTAGCVIASLVAIVAGCASAISAAESPRRYVFHSRPTFWTAMILLLGGAVVAARLVIRRPFDGIFSSGEFTAITIADAGAIFAVVASFAGGGVAAFAWWDAHRDERAWSPPFFS